MSTTAASSISASLGPYAEALHKQLVALGMQARTNINRNMWMRSMYRFTYRMQGVVTQALRDANAFSTENEGAALSSVNANAPPSKPASAGSASSGGGGGSGGPSRSPPASSGSAQQAAARPVQVGAAWAPPSHTQQQMQAVPSQPKLGQQFSLPQLPGLPLQRQSSHGSNAGLGPSSAASGVSGAASGAVSSVDAAAARRLRDAASALAREEERRRSVKAALDRLRRAYPNTLLFL
jgi:hypothetical protein